VGGAGGQDECLRLDDDKFGLTWQINYACLPELITGGKADKVMGAMMGMKKIDIQALKDAAA